jgi:protocatechuate 3,4-dioxygenase beta subunit
MRWHSAALLCSIAVAVLNAKPDEGSISGSVVDENGVPLAGATVYLIVEHGGCPSGVKTTDANGRFEFGGADPGTYRLRGEKPGYVTQMFRERETGGRGFGQSIVLTPSHPSDDTTVVLPRAAATISGTVYGEDRNPLPDGGWVFFADEQHNHVASTGLPSGRYSVSNLPRGRYYVSARRYSPAARQAVGDAWYYPDTVDENRAELVSLGDTPTYIDIHFGEPRPPAVSFRVRSGQGLPVARAEISVARLRDRDRHAGGSGTTPWVSVEVVRTNADGIAMVRGLAPGHYCAFVSTVSPPFSSWRNATSSTSLDHYAKSFRLADGDGGALVDFVVVPGLRLAGRFVMRDGGAPPPSHGVTIDFSSSPRVGGFRGDMTFLVKPRSIDDLHFEVEGLFPHERYTIREFDANPLKPVVVVGLRMNGMALDGADVIASSNGAADPMLEVILDRSAAISGTVKDRNVRRATAYPLSGDLPAAMYRFPATTDVSDGRFVFRGLPPGEYDISLEGKPRLRRVRVAAGQIADLAF